MHFASRLLLLSAIAALQSSSAFAPQWPSSTSTTCPATINKSTALQSTGTNKNGIPFGTPDPEIKCAFFRIINPRTDKYSNFREDLDAGGLDPAFTDKVGWPLIYIQQGHDKAMNEGVGLDTSDLDGYLDGVLSHKDLMWPHRDEIAEQLKSREAKDGTISIGDLFDAKQFTAEKNDMDTPTFGSYNEISALFLICGGDVDTGKVLLTSILDFFNGIPPSTRGRVTQESLDEANKILTEARQPSPSPLRSVLRSGIKNGFRGRNGVFKFFKAVFLVGSGIMKRKVLE